MFPFFVLAPLVPKPALIAFSGDARSFNAAFSAPSVFTNLLTHAICMRRLRQQKCGGYCSGHR
jgi:hypothetical protein